MDRRSFLKTGMAGTVAGLVGAEGEATATPRTPDPPPTVAAFELDEATVADLQRRIHVGFDKTPLL